jgi:hypothetical protein
VSDSPTSARRPPSLWARWTALLREREPGTSLALFRIACGLCVLVSVGGAVLSGVAGDVWLDRADGGYRTLASPPWLFRLLGGVHPGTLWPVLVLLLTSAFLLVIGLGGRITAFLVLQLYMAVAQINWHTRGCDDLLTTNALWLVVLSRSTATLSLDCRLRTGRWSSDTPVPAWPRYLAIYQLVLVYFTTGLQKVSIAWTPAGDFSALYYILQEPSWQRWDLRWLAWVYPLTQVATALTWFWELSSPLLLLDLWYRRTRSRPGWLRAFYNRLHFRRWFVLLGILMHLGVFVLIGLGPFTWITLSFYVCLFRPAEWQAAGRRLQRFCRNVVPAVSPAAPEEPPRPHSCQAALVCALVTLHVVAVTLKAIPAPAGATDRAAWKSPLAQEEFAAWADRLGSWGISVTPTELEEWLWDATGRFLDVRDRILAPFEPYYQFCGTGQGWRMFVGPNRYPTRLSIDIEELDTWQTIYAERAPHNAWRHSRLDHEHLRTAIFTMAFFKEYKRFDEFADWIARRAGQAFPRARRVRVRLYEFRTLPPDEVRAGHTPPGKFVRSKEFDLTR